MENRCPNRFQFGIPKYVSLLCHNECQVGMKHRPQERLFPVTNPLVNKCRGLFVVNPIWRKRDKWVCRIKLNMLVPRVVVICKYMYILLS